MKVNVNVHVKSKAKENDAIPSNRRHLASCLLDHLSRDLSRHVPAHQLLQIPAPPYLPPRRVDRFSVARGTAKAAQFRAHITPPQWHRSIPSILSAVEIHGRGGRDIESVHGRASCREIEILQLSSPIETPIPYMYRCRDDPAFDTDAVVDWQSRFSALSRSPQNGPSRSCRG